MEKQIAIIYTTFLRDELMTQTINSIFKNWRNDFLLLVGDQQPDLVKEQWLPNGGLYGHLPFDCGVSFARNLLIEQAQKRGIEFCLLTADSIKFTPQTIQNLDKAVAYLRAHPEVGILGFDLRGRPPWEYFMDIQNGRFLLKANPVLREDETTGLLIKECDICRQFFIARTEALAQVKWDDQLKTGEHEDFFWRFKASGWKVRWTPMISADYVNDKPEEYVKYRNRQYNEFRQKLFAKYKLSDWVEYVT